MTPKRILIVEPDPPLALSVAACFTEEGHATAVAGGAGEAELEIAAHRPDLVVVRAELPDLSGFSLCARLRQERGGGRLAVILYSSDTAPASLAEHARTPFAASGYLAMPLDTDALTTMARGLLLEGEPVELADDAILEEADGAEAAPAATPVPAAPPVPAGPQPPRLPGRPRRDLLTEADRLFVGRTFQSVGDRRDELAAEAERRRPPPRRDLLGSPEGRLSLLREDLKWREAQLAKLGELWEAREREVASSDARVHGAAVAAQAAQAEAEDLRRRLAQAQANLQEKDRAHGASIEGLLLEKFKDEKDLIEVVAATERRLHERGRELRASEEARTAREAELEQALARAEALEGEGREARARVAALEGQVDGLDRALREAAERIAVQVDEVEARDELLRTARREVERLQGELSAARQALMLRETELRSEIGRVRSEAEEVTAALEAARLEVARLQVPAEAEVPAWIAEAAAGTAPAGQPIAPAQPAGPTVEAPQVAEAPLHAEAAPAPAVPPAAQA